MILQGKANYLCSQHIFRRRNGLDQEQVKLNKSENKGEGPYIMKLMFEMKPLP